MKNSEFEDAWARDPSVQMMRRVFHRMEMLQKELLGRTGISPFDERLRRVRQISRDFFEKLWPLAQRGGLTRNEKDAATLYVHCLAAILRWERIEVSAEAFTEDKQMSQFIKENSR